MAGEDILAALFPSGARSNTASPADPRPRPAWGTDVPGEIPAPWGYRQGTNDPKGMGWNGVNKMTDGSGSVMTELTTTMTLDGNDVNMPLVVPTLSESERAHLLSGAAPTQDIYKKAADHAVGRLGLGLSPYAD